MIDGHRLSRELPRAAARNRRNHRAQPNPRRAHRHRRQHGPRIEPGEVRKLLGSDGPCIGNEESVPACAFGFGCNLGQERDVQQAMEAGATAYFIKADLSLHALVQRVEEALAAGGA